MKQFSFIIVPISAIGEIKIIAIELPFISNFIKPEALIIQGNFLISDNES